MITLWTVVRFLHVACAILWVGGQLTLSLVVRPAAKRALDEDRRTRLFTDAGRQFANVANLVLIPVLLATGLALAWHRGVTLQILSRAGYGSILSAKIVLALVSFALAGAHGVVARRSSSRPARILGITGAVVSVAVVFLATALIP